MTTTAILDLAALGVKPGCDEIKETKLKALLIGPPKRGKSTLCTTLPRPLIIQCDGRGALGGALVHGSANVNVFNCNTPKQWVAAQDIAAKLVKADLARSIVVDTATLLVDNILDGFSAQGAEGHRKWGMLADSLVGGVRRLKELDAHLVIVAHMRLDEDTDEGIVPDIAGSSRRKVAALVNHVVMLHSEGEPPTRKLVIGPRGQFKGDGRSGNLKKAAIIDADFRLLFNELELAWNGDA